MAVLIAKKVAFDLSKAFKMLVTSDNSYLCIYYPFSDSEGTCWEERLPLKEDTDSEALLSYLVQAKESDVILVWEDLLKNFRKSERRGEEEVQLREEIERVKELVETVADSVVVDEKEDEIIKDLIAACDYFLNYHIKNLGRKRDIDSVISMLAHILYEVAKIKALRRR